MPSHRIKTPAEIEEEIRRRAQGAADAAGAGIVIPQPRIVAAEKNLYGSHWIIETIAEPGVRYVERAAVQISHIWDIRTE